MRISFQLVLHGLGRGQQLADLFLQPVLGCRHLHDFLLRGGLLRGQPLVGGLLLPEAGVRIPARAVERLSQLSDLRLERGPLLLGGLKLRGQLRRVAPWLDLLRQPAGGRDLLLELGVLRLEGRVSRLSFGVLGLLRLENLRGCLSDPQLRLELDPLLLDVLGPGLDALQGCHRRLLRVLHLREERQATAPLRLEVLPKAHHQRRFLQVPSCRVRGVLGGEEPPERELPGGRPGR